MKYFTTALSELAPQTLHEGIAEKPQSLLHTVFHEDANEECGYVVEMLPESFSVFRLYMAFRNDNR